jgi:hypothetical protein
VGHCHLLALDEIDQEGGHPDGLRDEPPGSARGSRSWPPAKRPSRGGIGPDPHVKMSRADRLSTVLAHFARKIQPWPPPSTRDVFVTTSTASAYSLCSVLVECDLAGYFIRAAKVM